MGRPRGGGTIRAQGEQAVTPVVGSILILVIMMLAIGGIVAWGVPAIQGLQDQAEFQSVRSQFLQLDSDLQALRDPQNTRVPVISLAKGHLSWSVGDRWVITAARDSNYNAIRLAGWEGSNPASVTLSGATIDADNQITVEVVEGGTFTTTSSCTATCTSTVSLGTAKLNTDDVRIQIKEGTVRAEMWILNAGRLSYQQDLSHERNQVHLSMGALFTQQNAAFFIDAPPAIKEPDYDESPKDSALFVRFIQLEGNANTVGGSGRFPVVLNLVDNYGASRGRPSFDPATMVRLQINGDLAESFCNYYDDRDVWQSEDANGAAVTCPATGATNVRFVPPVGETLLYELNQAVVKVTVRSL